MRTRTLPPIKPRASKAPKRLETDLKTLADAANEAAKREAAQWFYFVTIMLTLAAIVGSTTHRVLFLEDPVKVPLLSVELPLRGFYVVAPAIFVVLHFYLLAQVRLMAGKVRAFLDAAREEAGKDDAAFEKALKRIDGFSVAQLIVADRLGRVALAVRAMAWVTLVVAPVLLLLFFQVRFLPFHSEWITGWHRVLVLVDLVLIWALWPSLESGPMTQAAVQFGRLGGVGVVMFFSGLVATIPGERLDREGGDLALKRLLFDGPVDQTTHSARSPFARKLILIGEDFVHEAEAALPGLGRTRSLRGRDLSFAVIDGADLRRVDFTGAVLRGAELRSTRLNQAIFVDADLRGATLDGADMRGAILLDARLHGASLVSTRLDGALMAGGISPIMGRRFAGTVLVGARLDCASLQGTVLLQVDLRGASMVDVDFGPEASSLQSANVRGAVVSQAIRGGQNLWNVLEGNVQVFPAGGTYRCFQAWDIAEHDRGSRPQRPPTPMTRPEVTRTITPTEAAKILIDLACDASHGTYTARGLQAQFGVGPAGPSVATRVDEATFRQFRTGIGSDTCPRGPSEPPVAG